MYCHSGETFCHVLQVEVTMGGEDDEPEIEISNDADGLPLAVANVPVILSISQVSKC
jgi:hypothetical protein